MKATIFFLAIIFVSCQSPQKDYTQEILSLVYNTEIGKKKFSSDSSKVIFYVNDQEKIDHYSAKLILQTFKHDADSLTFDVLSLIQDPTWSIDDIINKSPFQLISEVPNHPDAWEKKWLSFSNNLYSIKDLRFSFYKIFHFQFNFLKS